MPINEVRGDHLLQTPAASSVDLSQIDLKRIAAEINEPVLSAKIKPWLKQTVVAIKTQHNNLLFDAQSAQPITIDAQQVSDILSTQLKPGHQTVSKMQLLETVPNEARGRNAPLWQVQLEGSENARIYISAQTGEIVAKRTDRWRLFDFMWMLHIMDYDDRENFNHPLLYLTALSALVFTLTGFVLLFFSLRRKRKQL